MAEELKDYILKGSTEWDDFIQEIMSIKNKSNRQVLCVKWWVLLNYEQKIKHIRSLPEHEKYILTSSKFASAWQICSLALACNKIVYKPEGEYIKSPFQEAGSFQEDTAQNVAEMQALPTDNSPNDHKASSDPNWGNQKGEDPPNEENKEDGGKQDITKTFWRFTCFSKTFHIFILIDLSNDIYSNKNIENKPKVTVEVLETKIKTLQDGIDSLKVLFTQVLERVNVVNQENNILRGLIFQNQNHQGVNMHSFNPSSRYSHYF